MDEIIEFTEQYNEIQFLVSLDYNQDSEDDLTYYSCDEWGALYSDLGNFGNTGNLGNIVNIGNKGNVGNIGNKGNVGNIGYTGNVGNIGYGSIWAI